MQESQLNNAGSCNEKAVAAVKDQVGDIMHTFNYPYTIPQALLAEKVCETIGMDKIFYQNSGTEANEAMIKMARKYGIEKYGPNHYHIVTAKMGSMEEHSEQCQQQDSREMDVRSDLDQ